jgi:hypothetical protein
MTKKGAKRRIRKSLAPYGYGRIEWEGETDEYVFACVHEPRTGTGSGFVSIYAYRGTYDAPDQWQTGRLSRNFHTY